MTGSGIASVCFRVGELISAAIVAGIDGYYLHLLDQADAHIHGRIVYTVLIAGIRIICSIVVGI